MSFVSSSELACHASHIVPVNRPRLPSAGLVGRYLLRTDAARYYTNHGPLAEELQRRLADRFGLPAQQAVLASSGTAGLVGAILAVAGRATEAQPYCICPAFTFVATAIAAITCGFEPLIVDVDPMSWSLLPAMLKDVKELDRVGLVIPVAPMGLRPELDPWNGFQAETGIPVVMDAAACFDTLDRGQLQRCDYPVVVSLHATKTMSTAEGGLVLCRDKDQATDISRALNFGFMGSRESVGPSTNGKLSEYHAAVGLADLDGWADKRAGFLAAAAGYREAARRFGIDGWIFVDEDQATPYAHVLAPGAAAARAIMAALAEAGFDSRRWYLDGLHRHPALASAARTVTPVTDDLAPRLVGLPFACDLEAQTIRRIVGVIAGALTASHAMAIDAKAQPC